MPVRKPRGWRLKAAPAAAEAGRPQSRCACAPAPGGYAAHRWLPVAGKPACAG